MLARNRAFRFTLLVLVVAAAGALSARADEWQPISPEELKMTSEPLAPGAPAIILYRQLDRDDVENREFHYRRIKVLTEEGRKYADVEIPFVKGFTSVRGIKARTIQPDGRVQDFDGQIYDKTLVKVGEVKINAKTLALADVRPGSIIEYRYTLNKEPGLGAFAQNWSVQEDIFTKEAHFSFHPVTSFMTCQTTVRNFPPGWPILRKEGPVFRLDMTNVPAFQTEDYMPPDEEVKPHVEITYTFDGETDPDRFWKNHGKRIFGWVNEFVSHHKEADRVTAETIQPTDPPETKLRKIYTRVQQIRNLSYERKKTQEEVDREKRKNIYYADDILKRGYGDGWDITWVFLAMVRSAGFQAWPVEVAARNSHFFEAKLMNTSDLDANVVLVEADAKKLYLDPGAKFAPFGLLPWPETATAGLKLDKDGGAFVTTPAPGIKDARIERKAALRLTDMGDLEGTLTVTYSGLEAMWRRTDEYNEDATAQKKFLEDEVTKWIPAAATAVLENEPDWTTPAETMTAEFSLKVPGWTTTAGRRTVLPATLFSGAERHVFEHASRSNPIYFKYAHQEFDDVSIELPAGLQVETLPAAKKYDEKFWAYVILPRGNGNVLRLQRLLAVGGGMISSQNYPAIRSFFQTVRGNDEQQVVLRSGGDSNGR